MHNYFLTDVDRYSIHLWDLKHPGTWESKGTYVYYTDFTMELAMLFLDLMHHIHMLVRDSVWHVDRTAHFLHLPSILAMWTPRRARHASFHSFSATSGCPWPVWLSSCSCATSSTRCSGVSVATRTTFVSSTTWRRGNVFGFSWVCRPCEEILTTQRCWNAGADSPSPRQRSWPRTMTIAPSAGTQCSPHANCPADISSTSKIVGSSCWNIFSCCYKVPGIKKK